jgi:hypothetical protein
VDARLVKSASRPLSQDELKKQRIHRNSEEGQRDKKGNPLKFTRDLESDWTNKNDIPHYFGISHLHDRAKRARFTTIIKNQFDSWFRQTAFNVSRGMKIISRATI